MCSPSQNPLPSKNFLSQKFPLSINQQSIWLFEQLYPSTPTYHIPLAYQCVGKLNLSALEQALNEMVRHHQALRTTFAIDDNDTPQQQIAPPSPVTVTVIDLSNLPESLSANPTQHIINQEICCPFQLAQDRLWRVAVLHLPQSEQILLFTFHHLLQNFELPNLNLTGLTTTSLPVSTGTAKFDFTLELYEKAEGLNGWFEYNTALFSAALMQRLAEYFQTLLESIVIEHS